MSRLSEFSKTLIPHHICIQTNNYRASLQFYTEVLGFIVVEETQNFKGRAFNSWLEMNGFFIELQTPKEDNVFDHVHPEISGINHFCFYTPSIHSLFYEIQTHFPSTIIKPIYTVFSTQLFKIKAPEGTIIEFRDNHNA